MNKLLATGIALAALIGKHALAADMPVKAPPAVAATVFSWTGFYAGVNAGYGWGDNAISLTGDPFSLFVEGVGEGVLPTSIAANPRGFVGGAQIGWNYQSGQVVYGVEADLDYAHIKSSGTVLTPSAAPPISLGIPRTLMGSQSLDWLSTFRARLGFTPADRLLLFVTGGGAAGRANLSVGLTTNDLGGVAGSGCVAGTCEANSASNTLWGWSAGVGAEYAIGGNWSLRADYLHYDLGSISTNAVDPRFAPGTNSMTGTAHFRGEIARAGVNVKFP
jgi:outer membrane immunogenic protein